MKLITIDAPEFDLEKTLNSGQVFHWQKAERGFVGTIDTLPIWIEQTGSALKIRVGDPAAGSASSSRSIVAGYFALDHDLAAICASLPTDPVMDAASEYCRGLRIIRQPLWECLATFICSSMKQVAHIRQISSALRQRFGTKAEVAGQVVYAFPTAARVANCSENELRQCGLGYRAQNLRRTARRVASGEAGIENWRTLADRELEEALETLPGVGAKVAHCVMLFAYERLRAFPVDVWIERVLREKYRKTRSSQQRLRRFTAEYFGDHGGYAQQYLFHHARTSKRSVGSKKASGTAGRRFQANPA